MVRRTHALHHFAHSLAAKQCRCILGNVWYVGRYHTMVPPAYHHHSHSRIDSFPWSIAIVSRQTPMCGRRARQPTNVRWNVFLHKSWCISMMCCWWLLLTAPHWPLPCNHCNIL